MIAIAFPQQQKSLFPIPQTRTCLTLGEFEIVRYKNINKVSLYVHNCK